MTNRLRFKRITIAAAPTRTPITAIISCSAVAIENSDTNIDVKLWDAETGGDYKDLLARGELSFYAPLGRHVSKGHMYPSQQRFDEGEAVCWVEPVGAGTPTVVVTFLL